MLLQELKECFEKKDVGMLQEAVTKIPKDEAEYHIQRCIDSGLWVPGGGVDASADDDKPDEEDDEEEEGETYEDLDDATAID